MFGNKLLLISTLTLVGCGVEDAGLTSGRSIVQGYPSMGQRWPTSTIAVCWEASAAPWVTERAWVQNKIRSAYETKTSLRFVGWNACPDPTWPLPYRFDGISVAIRNSGKGGHAVGLGTALRDVRKGLNFNFRFDEIEGFKDCVGKEQACIENIALHEFGHAIGMAHEQNRPDTPGFCNERQGSNGSRTVGHWDLDSVMNYCNPVWNNDGRLSPKDVDTIQVMYPDPEWPERARRLINQRYAALGASGGALGIARQEVTPTPDGYGFLRGYDNGWIYATPGRGAFEIYGAIGQRWMQLGWERFGYPVTGELSTPDGVGRYNHFEDGRSIYWSPATGAHEVYGEIRFLWSNMGWERSYLGFPTTGELSTPDGKARVNHFQNGSIYWRPGVGPIAVPKVVMVEWGKHDWERGFLGYPVDQPTFVGTFMVFQNFEHGRIYWNKDRGSWVVPG